MGEFAEILTKNISGVDTVSTAIWSDSDVESSTDEWSDSETDEWYGSKIEPANRHGNSSAQIREAVLANLEWLETFEIEPQNRHARVNSSPQIREAVMANLEWLETFESESCDAPETVPRNRNPEKKGRGAAPTSNVDAACNATSTTNTTTTATTTTTMTATTKPIATTATAACKAELPSELCSDGGQSDSEDPLDWPVRVRRRHPRTKAMVWRKSELSLGSEDEEISATSEGESVAMEMTDAESSDTTSTFTEHLVAALESVSRDDRRVSGQRRACRLCQEPHRNFGDVCASCRKVGPRGSVQQCRDCDQFFQGFGNKCLSCMEYTARLP